MPLVMDTGRILHGISYTLRVRKICNNVSYHLQGAGHIVSAARQTDRTAC